MGFLGFSPPQGMIATRVASGAPIGGLSSGLVAYGDSAGAITSEAAFAYNATTNTLTLTETAGVKTIAFSHDGTNGLIAVSSGSLRTTAKIIGGQLVNGSANCEISDAYGTLAGLYCNSTAAVQWFSGALNTTMDLALQRNAASIMSVAGINGGRSLIGQATTTVNLSGATSVATNLVPAKVQVIGVICKVTTTITGASGFQVGDGTDADRWGDITGTATSVTTTYADYTADPRLAWSASAQSITLTAKTSNFTGGVLRVTVLYLADAALTS